MRRHKWWAAGTAVGLCLALAGCGGGSTETAPPATRMVSQPAASPSAEKSTTTAPTLRGNPATNPACKLLSLDEVANAASLNVIGVLGLLADTTNPAKHSESCTWYLEPKYIQSSLVVQYTLFARPPADLKAYYPQVIAQGLGRVVPQLGDISKIEGHVLDTIDRRAEIHISLLIHAEATAEDQAEAIAVMRLVMAGIPQ